MKWPPEVEVVAAVFRGAGMEARLEQLPEGESQPPGLAVRVDAYDCQGRVLVALVGEDRELDPRKLLSVGRCAYARPVAAPAFPFPRASVFIDRLVLSERTVWLPAGSPRFAVALSPTDLARLTRAQAADLVADA